MNHKQFQKQFSSRGGKARKKALTPERRKEIASRAAKARWAKHKLKPRQPRKG